MRNRSILSYGVMSIAIISIFFMARASQAQQPYLEPGTTPPGGVISSPLNSSSTGQLKSGSLTIGNGDDVLCLNADAVSGLSDPENCISSWGDVANSLNNRFVKLSNANLLNVDPTILTNYAKQSGFARFQSTGVQQGFSAVVSAPNICVTIDPSSPTEYLPCGRASQPEACYCYYDRDHECSHDSDCVLQGTTSTPAITTGLYTTNGGLATNNAGVFGGKLYVFGNSYSPEGFIPGSICLNGTGGNSCVSSWDQVTDVSYSYVKLQAYTLGQPISPSEKQLGGASVTSSAGVINGLGHISSVLAGDPNTVSSVSCGSAPCICGDGMCLASVENSTNCAIDCAVIPSPIGHLSIGVQGAAGQGYFSAPQITPSNQAHLLVTRTTNAASTFTPQSGRKYITGKVYGDTTVIYANDINGGQFVPVTDASAITGVVYTYKTYYANRFPRYSAPDSKSAEYTTLTLTVSGGSNGGVYGTTNPFSCDSGCTNLVIYEVKNTTESLEAFLRSGCSISYSGACSGGVCNLLMNGPKTVSASISCSGSGGGGGPILGGP